MCNGEFKDKSPEDALDYLEHIAENAQHWDTIGTYESPSNHNHLVGGCSTLGKIMTFLLNMHL